MISVERGTGAIWIELLEFDADSVDFETEAECLLSVEAWALVEEKEPIVSGGGLLKGKFGPHFSRWVVSLAMAKCGLVLGWCTSRYSLSGEYSQKDCWMNLSANRRGGDRRRWVTPL